MSYIKFLGPKCYFQLSENTVKVKRMVMDDFLVKLKSLKNPDDMPITMCGPNDHYFVHILYEDLIFCAVLREGELNFTILPNQYKNLFFCLYIQSVEFVR